jgi:hypothetical protein
MIYVYVELLGVLHNAFSDYCFETPADQEILSVLAEEDKEWTDLSISNIEESTSHSQAPPTGRKGSAANKSATTTTTTANMEKPFKLLREALKKKINILLW